MESSIRCRAVLCCSPGIKNTIKEKDNGKKWKGRTINPGVGDQPQVGRYRTTLLRRGCRAAARIDSYRTLARAHGCGTAMGTSAERAVCRRAGGCNRQSGRAASPSRVERHLCERLAGGRGRQRRRPHVSRPEFVSRG